MTWRLVQPVNGTMVDPATGLVWSWNPTTPYEWQTRPAGTAGAYEKCLVNGAGVCYNPAGVPFVFGYQPSVPNTPGLSAMTVDPLT